MAASDLWVEVGDPGSATTLDANYTAGDTSVTVVSTTNWPSVGKAVIFAMDEAEVVDGKEVQVAGTYNEFEGTVASATSISNVDQKRGVGDRNYTAGSLTRVYIPVSAERENRLVTGLEVEHNQDGTHGDVTADSIVVSGNVTAANFVQTGGTAANGWTVGLPAASSPTALGNRSYTLPFASDVSDTLSPGMRLRVERTVAAPTTAFSLDGSNDYYSKTSPTGLSFTTTFTCSAWVYMTSYAYGGIIARRNADVEGWTFGVIDNGTVNLTGLRIASNNKGITSYQSIPLNKWVHIAATLDMSAGDTTAQKIWIDGVEVPRAYNVNGTVTALVQGTTALVVGARKSDGTHPFPGYIDQAAVFSSQLSDATIKAMQHQALVGSESTLVSAYSNGSTTDLNTTNANNLTAQNGATTVASSWHGDRGTSATLDYGLVMAVSGTDVTLQVPEGCTIPTSGGITSVSYSTQANPYGFVSDKGRWNVEMVANADPSVAASANTWYNLGSYRISKPTGPWNAYAIASVYGQNTSASTANKIFMALSTSSSTSNDSRFTSTGYTYTSTSDTKRYALPLTVQDNISDQTSITLYLLAKMQAAGTLDFRASGDDPMTKIILTPTGL